LFLSTRALVCIDVVGRRVSHLLVESLAVGLELLALSVVAAGDE
jgi:hypothetical protein